MEWNPNKTGKLGLEWPASMSGVYALDSVSKAVATSLVQTTSQIIGAVQVPNAGIPVRGGLYALEVYDDVNAVPVDFPTTLVAVPNEDVTDGNWLNSAGNNTSLFSYIDEGSTPNTTDLIYIAGAGSTVTQRFNTGSLSLTGKRILQVRLKLYADQNLAGTGSFIAGLNLGGVNYPLMYGIPYTRASWWAALLTYNPSTNKPWTIADVQALDTTDEFYITGETHALSHLNVYTVVLEVVVVTENRLAVGVLDDTASGLVVGTVAAPAWNSASVLTPTGGAWTKDASGKHLYTLRKFNTNGNGTMNVPYLDSGAAAPAGESWDVALDPTYGYVTTMDAGSTTGSGVGAAGILPLTRLYPFLQRTTVPADSVDSQPYCAQVQAQVTSTNTAQSEFSGAAATAYGVVTALVQPSAIGTPGDLSIKVKRRSDNVQLGSTLTLTAATIAALPDVGNGWKFIQAQLPSNATLAAATQYYLEFSTASGMWLVLVLTCNGAGQTATYDGTTDAATYSGLAENLSADITATIATVPAAPASMTAALGSQSVGETVGCVTAISRADLSWATTSLGAAFTRYEIQRSEDAGATWLTIAYVTVESVLAWKDYEARRGVAASYRVRVVRNDGAFSAWTTAAATVTKPLLAGTGAYSPTMFLVSNYSPSLNLAYEYAPTKRYAFNEADEQVRRGVYGQDYEIAANPTENRGVTATWTLLVGIDDKVPSGGGFAWNAYTPLRALARAAIPYVCVLDHFGNRMYAALSVPQGDQDTTGGAERYLTSMSATEVAGTPYVVSVAA